MEKTLFNDIFEEISIKNDEEIGTGDAYLCAMLAYACVHGVVVGGSGSMYDPDYSACELMEKYCT